ncbi:serine/threonine protein kinase [Actinoplanes sp. LDG1-06]|uniref:non-specific serine/threonine protein kinase n=2 Tax=Paractinoplanes ovalisporus TaxID=2810368 RepID=A0ABS2ASG5_9ACTN|nr:serine/threonine protein kinase [Actinoplanes ovalisporus]
MLSDRYRLTQRLAAGGMGEVWRGEDVMLHRQVAIKVMLPALRNDPQFVTRFRTEARMMAALRHPGIVQVYDYGETTQGDYLVMEFVEGIPLSKRLEQAGRLGPGETMAIVAQVADALQVAHEAGIVHRDVKPANLLVRPGGAIVLVDFGVARSQQANGLTGTNVVLGSANYMAPEQAEGKPIGPGTDVYALGAVAYCCLTGRPPYVGDNPLQVMTQLVYGDLPTLPPDVPPPVAAIVMRSLAKEPQQRFASAADMAAAARNPGRPGTGSMSRPLTPPQTRAFRQPGGATSGGFAGGAMPGGPGGTMSGGPGGATSGGYGNTGGRGAQPSGPGHTAAGFPSAGRAQVGGPRNPGQTSGRMPIPQSAQAGGFQAGRAQAVPRTPQTGFHTSVSASGAAAVPRPGASGGMGGGTGSGPRAGEGNSSGKKRNWLLIAAVVAVVMGVGGVAVAMIPTNDDPGVTNGAGLSGDDTIAGGDETTEPTTKPTKTRTKAPKPTSTTEAPADPTGEASPTETQVKAPDSKQVCGDGFKVVEQKALRNDANVAKGRVVLLHNDDNDQSCVVTVRLTSNGRNVPMTAFLEYEGQSRVNDGGDYDQFAKVTADGADACLKWGGSINELTYEGEQCD